MVFVPYAQDPRAWLHLAVRTGGDPRPLAPAVLSAIRSVDAEEPVSDVKTMEDVVHHDATGLMYVAGLLTAGAGMALGLPVAFQLARMSRSLIFDVTAGAPATFAGVPLVLLAVAAVAIYVPARRAVRVDPTVALRCE